MPATINWLNDLAKAQEIAQAENRPIFLDFFNPQ
jgi:hypothetical protein